MRAATLRWACVGLLVCLSAQAWAVDAARLDYQLQPRQIAPDTWVIEGAVEDFSRANGCNIINTGFVSTAAGTLVLNTGPSRLYGEQQKAALERVKVQPVKQVVSLNLHPDYFLGNQAWRDVPTAALPGSRVGMQAEGKAYEDNLYRLCGDWMRGTEFRPSRQDIQPGRFDWGGHAMEWVRLQGHTDDDLVLIDHSTGVLFAGGSALVDPLGTLLFEAGRDEGQFALELDLERLTAARWDYRYLEDQRLKLSGEWVEHASGLRELLIPAG